MNPRRWLVVVLVLLSACSTATWDRAETTPSAPTAVSPSAVDGARTPGEPAVVTRTVDGDTIHVAFRGHDLDVRLIGIDTPETVDPSQPVQCYGEQASRFTERSLTGRTVRLEFDVERHDRYGRTLAYVWVRGHLFNRRLVSDGYAVVDTFPPNVRYEGVFMAAQAVAQRDDRGLWAACPVAEPHRCDPAYPGVCIASPPPDLDCADITFRRFQVLPPDPHNFDGDHNGIGCET
jgi:micrococcal nuclease